MIDQRAVLQRELEAVNATILEVISTPEDATTYHNRAFTQKRLTELYQIRDRILGELAIAEQMHGGGLGRSGHHPGRFV